MKQKRLLIQLLVLTLLMTIAWPAQAQTGSYPLENCKEMGFSTEEDFMMQEGEPYDGNPYISDGDLLSPNGQLCARNADLLLAFYPNGVPPIDLGLDAVDILEASDRIVAFSTELDEPFGGFTAGDLLFTNGGVIPNRALTRPFEIRHDIGLDALHFVGDQGRIIEFTSLALQLTAEDWLNGRLQEELERYQIDIWFSIEGTHQQGERFILDGDILSALTGTIVASNADLLRVEVPAGLPLRGIDFGADALTAPRIFSTAAPLTKEIRFSTEILYRHDEFGFNDGDVMLFNTGIETKHEDLIAAWGPAARFLGLDALSSRFESERPVDPNIQTMCGDDKVVVNFNGGTVPIGGGGTGLYGTNPRRPCGEYVPIDGFLPATGVKRYRVAYRPAGDPVPAIGAANGIQTEWKIKEWFFGCIFGGMTLTTDANGWMDAAQYLGMKDGSITGCTNSGLRLAVWDTNNKMGFGPANKDGHYVMWLEWEDNGGILHREPVEHHIQLDNTRPTIAPFPNGLQVRMNDGSTIVPTCGEAPAGASEFQVWGDFEDDYYWNFSLQVRGGLPPTSVSYGPHNYYDVDDGTPPIKNTDDTGTTPDGNLVRLRDIDMTDFGDAFQDCCYLLDMWVRDAAIRHSFNKVSANDNSGSSAYQANAFVTFAAAP